MSTGNYLTIRDYLDRAIMGGPKPKISLFHPALSRRTNETEPFQRILMARQTTDTANTADEPSGLTLADYLADRVPAHGLYRYASDSLSSAINSETNAEDLSPAPSPSATEHVSEAAHQPSQPSGEAPRVSLPNAAAPEASRPTSASGDPVRQTIEKSIHKAAAKYNLSPQLIAGVIRAESNFQADAVSRAGAQGLMQLMPATARELGVTHPFDIDQNIDGGSHYLRKMLDNFDGNVKLALAAYNAGPGTVRKYEGNVPYRETMQYVDRVLQFAGRTV